MKISEVMKWNKRVSAVYALGIWVMIGSYSYYRYTAKPEENKTDKKEEVEKNPNEVVYQTPHMKTIMVYKEDFVPYTTRVYDFITSFSGPPRTGGGGN